MGEVYLARDTRLGRRVALKIISPERLGGPQAIERFLFEARTTAQFNHPHIITIYNVGEHEGAPYVALEFLDGETLRERLSYEQLSSREALRLGLAVAAALAEAHRHQVLHRDLKPENIFLPKDGRIRVLDFGLAKVFARNKTGQRDRDNTALSYIGETLAGSATESGIFKSAHQGVRGTPAYMSPEQWGGGECTAPSDIWSLGVILYEVLSGRRPYEGANYFQLREKVMSADPVPPLASINDVSTECTDLVNLCLQKDPEKRPTASDVVSKLEYFLYQGRAAPLVEQNPFRGLQPFLEEHAAYYFGREEEVSFFLERMRESTVLPIIGSSGSGKSSFVQAGIIPRLREQGKWTVLTVRPGDQPFHALALRLATAEKDLAETLAGAPLLLNLWLHKIAKITEGHVLLFVDQFEELFTLVSDPRIQESYIRAICHAADDLHEPVRVIFNLREDYLTQLALVPETRSVLRQVTMITKPDRSSLARTLTKPIELLGYRFDDPGIVEQVVSALESESACLPLLQFCASLLWEVRDRDHKILSRSAYEAMGGVAGALARHADRVLYGLSEEQLAITRDLLLRLVTPEATRRIMPAMALLDGLGNGATELLTRLVEARLVSVIRGDGETGEAVCFELAHESLIRTWTRLSRWLEESRVERKLLEDISQAAELWDKRGRRDDEVWRGEALKEARRVLAQCSTVPPELVRRFLDAGSLREQQFRRRRQYVGMLAFLAACAVAISSTIFSIILDRQKEMVKVQHREARWRLAESQHEGASAAWLRGEILEARAKLRGSLEVQDSRLARSLWRDLNEQPFYGSRQLGGPVYGTVFTSDGENVIASSGDKLIYILDRRTMALKRLLRGSTDQVIEIAISPNGQYLAAASWTGEIRFWPLKDGPEFTLPGHLNGINALAFSPDGAMLASGGNEGIRLWDIKRRQIISELIGHREGVTSLEFLPQGKLLVSTSLDGKILLWDVAQQKVSDTLVGHKDGVLACAVSPDGKELASVGMDGELHLTDLETHKLRYSFNQHTASINVVAYSPDGRYLVTSGDDKKVSVWDRRRGKVVQILSGHQAVIYRAAFSPDGRWLSTASGDKTVRVWRISSDNEIVYHRGHSDDVSSVSFSPTNKMVASGSYDHTVRIWEVDSGRELEVFRGHLDRVNDVQFSPDGKYVASASSDHTVRLWDVQASLEKDIFSGHRGSVLSLDFSPDGKYLVTAGADKTARLWKVDSGAELRVFEGHERSVAMARFSPDGALLATLGKDHSIRVWNSQNGLLVKKLEHPDISANGLTFNHDGQGIIFSNQKNEILLWQYKTGVVREVSHEKGRLYLFAAHPDGQRLGVPLADGTSAILNTLSGERLILRGHQGEVNELVFSRNGKIAATASDDRTVRLWDTRTGRPLWRAPIMLPGKPEILTHRGWINLEHPAQISTVTMSKWQQAIAQRGRTAVKVPKGNYLCLQGEEERLELWDTKSDKLIWQHTLPGLDKILATPEGCVTISDGIVRLHSGDGNVRELAREANTITIKRHAIVVATGRHVLFYSLNGDPQAAYPVDRGVSAVGAIEDLLVLGYQDGNVDFLDLQRGGKWQSFALEQVPTSPVKKILAGPAQSIIVSYANGIFGLWSLETGRRLYLGQMHGSLKHLLVQQGKIYVVSELGDFETVDLSVMQIPYCDLLKQVWDKVPVIWESGQPVLMPPPRDHLCLTKN